MSLSRAANTLHISSLDFRITRVLQDSRFLVVLVKEVNLAGLLLPPLGTMH